VPPLPLRFSQIFLLVHDDIMDEAHGRGKPDPS